MKYLIVFIHENFSQPSYYCIDKVSKKESFLLHRFDGIRIAHDKDNDIEKLFARFGYDNNNEKMQNKKYYAKWDRYFLYDDEIENFSGQIIALHKSLLYK